METKPLFLTEKVIDEILIEDIFDDEGNILMGKNAIINEYAFHFLAKSKVKRVPIYPSKNSDCPNKGLTCQYFTKKIFWHYRK